MFVKDLRIHIQLCVPTFPADEEKVEKIQGKQ